MKFNGIEYPQISGIDRERPVTLVENDKLKDTGVAFNTYGIQKGDVITFPSTMDEIHVVSQPVRKGSTALQYLATVTKNGKPNWLSLGSLTRTDVNREPISKFNQEMIDLVDNGARVEHLLGKTIKCLETKKVQFQAFDPQTGERLDGKTVERDAPVITYAE